MNEYNQFPGMGVLLSRIKHAVESGQRVTFLVGSAVSAPGSRTDEPGVPDATTLVKQAVESFRSDDVFEALETVCQDSTAAERYQNVMKFMIDCRGPDALNKFIQNAVLKSRITPPQVNQNCEKMEMDEDGWHLRPAVKAIGQIVFENPETFAAPILTSNFDPLIEISLRKAGRSSASLCLPSDGKFTNVLAPNVTNVVHFHGYWRGSDTLHTPSQLTRNRPQLKGCLRSLLSETTLVVIGYGGWKDVFTRTLVDVISEQTEQLNVLWTFYSDNQDNICITNSDLLTQFETVAGQRIIFYKGIDCHVFLPHLRDSLREVKRNKLKERLSLLKGSVPVRLIATLDREDHPPQADAWVGRESEIGVMLSSTAKVIAVTGFGGNGKSTLAAKYIEMRKDSGEIEFFCWADCREKGNTLHTQLTRMVEKISRKTITAEQLREASAEGVIEALLDLLRSTKAILVFDNIDQYVDVETSRAVDAMDLLVKLALNRPHLSQFVFTGRPRLEYQDTEFLELPLGGLSVEETYILFQVRGVVIDVVNGAKIIDETHKITNGHPLALNLIATQVSKNKASLDDLIEKIKRGIDDDVINKVFEEIWNTLNNKQRAVLRYLAEQIHPESQQRVSSYLGDIFNYNQFSKATKILKSLNLIVIKCPNGPESETIELHPLIRDFIRRKYPLEERVPYIVAIIHYFDGIITKLRPSLKSAPYSVIEHWTSKVELCIQCKQYEEALKVLAEAHSPLRNRGYSEELVRLGKDIIDDYLPEVGTTDLTAYDKVATTVIQTLSELGRFIEADLICSKLETTITGKTARYVMLCQSRAYSLWLREQYDIALEWAVRGMDIKKMGNIDTNHDTAHTLALIQRETGHVDMALKYFLQGRTLASLITTTELDHEIGGHLYGNVGRCLQYLQRNAEAIICLKKSAKNIQEDVDGDSQMNAGWAAFWIGQTLESQKDFPLAISAFYRASQVWKTVSPPRSKRAISMIERIKASGVLHGSVDASEMINETCYLSWLSSP